MVGWHHGAWPCYSRGQQGAERQCGVADGTAAVPGSAGARPIFVRQQAVELYDQVIAGLGEAADLQVDAAHDADQILMQSQILMEF